MLLMSELDASQVSAELSQSVATAGAAAGAADTTAGACGNPVLGIAIVAVGVGIDGVEETIACAGGVPAAAACMIAGVCGASKLRDPGGGAHNTGPGAGGGAAGGLVGVEKTIGCATGGGGILGGAAGGGANIGVAED
jgi:hypothetical protein